MPKLKIDNVEIEVEPGTSILQAAEMLGHEVPRFCFHDKLSVPANCRMCLVEVKPGPPKPQASCALACADNMEVFTDSPMVHKARKGVMEMLLINHPLDCPICDQGGECDLQDQAVGYGYDRSRYYESKRAVKDKDFGPLIKTQMTRCIQCTRCIRFSDEIAGTTELGMVHRGEESEIDTLVHKYITSELSGNLIDVCPVGALTSKPYAFKARPWELKKTETIDVHDAVGANIRIDARGNEVMRVLPRLNEDVNEEWIDDRTRFAYDGLKRQRLDRPFIREDGRLRPATWDEAFALVSSKMKTSRNAAALAGPLCDLESMVALKDLMATMGSTAIECRTDGAQFDPSSRAGYIFNSGIAAIERADTILLIGTNPRFEAAMINARILKAWRNKRVKIALIGPAVDLNYPYLHLGEDLHLLEKLVSEYAGKVQAERPMMIIGAGVFNRPDGVALHGALRKAAEALGVVKDGWNGFNVLQNAASRVGALDIGFVTDDLDLPGKDVVYLLGVDEQPMLDQIPANAFVIYQGHHGDAGAMRADVILPGAAYTEKDGLYVNTEGRVQQAKQAVWAPGEAREDWKILRALSGHLGRTLPYDDIVALRGRMIRDWPHLGQLDVLVPAEWSNFGGTDKADAQIAFTLPVSNFYLTNVIARASLTMAKCAEQLSPQPETHLEAAE